MRRARSAWQLAVAAWLFWGSGAAAAAAGDVQEFHAFLLPDTIFTEPDSIFFVDFWVDSTAQQFNGYEVTVQWNPAVVESVVTVLKGSLMTGNPCGNTIAFGSSTDSTHTYEHVILCAGYSANGPGLLHTYHFRAGEPGVSPLAIVSDPICVFLDAGLCVWPGHEFPRQVVLHDAVVVVADDETSADPAPAVSTPSFGFFPNPTRGGGVFRLEPRADGPALLDVVDASGRRVLRESWARGAPEVFRWSGRGSGGAPLPAGVYFARLDTASGTAVRKIVILR